MGNVFVTLCRVDMCRRNDGVISHKFPGPAAVLTFLFGDIAIFLCVCTDILVHVVYMNVRIYCNRKRKEYHCRSGWIGRRVGVSILLLVGRRGGVVLVKDNKIWTQSMVGRNVIACENRLLEHTICRIIIMMLMWWVWVVEELNARILSVDSRTIRNQ